MISMKKIMLIISILLFIGSCSEPIRQYDNIELFEDGFASVQKKGKKGLINHKGKEVIPCAYEDIRRINDQLFIVTQFNENENEMEGVFSIKAGKELVPCKYYSVEVDTKRDLLHLSGEKEGYVDFNGKEVIPVIYESIEWQSGTDIAKVEVRIGSLYNRLYGYINAKGETLINTKYTSIEAYTEDKFIKAEKWGKWGYIDHKGNEKLPFLFEEVGNFDDNDLIWVKTAGRYGLANKKGETIARANYDSPIYFEEITDKQLAVVAFEGKYGIIDRTGKEVIAPTYNGIRYEDMGELDEEGFYEEGETASIQLFKNVAVVGHKGKYGIINNRTGKEISGFIYDKVDFPDENYLIVKMNNQWGVVQMNTGKIVLPFKYDFLWMSDEFAIARLDEKWGVVNLQGEIIIPFEYENIDPLPKSGFFNVKKDKWGVVDKNGKEIIAPKYTSFYTEEFEEDDLAWVSINGKDGILNYVTAKELIPCEYDDLSYNYDFIETLKNGKHILYNKKYQPIPNATYDKIEDFKGNADVAIVHRDGKKGLIDTQGKEVLPCKFKDIKPDYYRDIENHKSEKMYYTLFAEEGEGIADSNGNIMVLIDNAWIHTGTGLKENTPLIVVRNKKYGVISTSGEQLIPFKYDDIHYIEHNFAIAEIDGYNTLVDMQGKELVERANQYFHFVSSDIFVIEDRPSRKTRSLNKLNQRINTKNYKEYGNSFVEGLLEVKDTFDKWGFIDETGKEVIPCQYESVTQFSEGKAIAELNGISFYIDTRGKCVLPVEKTKK